jgi:hypothetical protein
MSMRKTTKKKQGMNIILITEYNEKKQKYINGNGQCYFEGDKTSSRGKKIIAEMEICCSDKFVIERNFYCNVM